MSKIIDDLNNDSTTYTVIANNVGDMSYWPSQHEIHWDWS